MKRFTVSLLVSLLCISYCSSQTIGWKHLSANPEFLHRSVKQVTDVIVHDIYSPPVASRIYAYIAIAGYEAARAADKKYLSLAGQLHGFKPVPYPATGRQYSFELAAVYAVLTVGKSLVSSEERIETFQSGIMHEFKETGLPAEVFANSLAYGKIVADHVMAYAATDNYKQSRSLPRYTPGNDPPSWKPTPPAYLKAIEPHWNRLRTFLLDSAQQFKPAPALLFSTDKESRFYKEAKDVYDAGTALTAEQKAMASFWDCNPFKMNINGHVMYATKKISPGGHWVNITRLACRKADADFMQSAEAYVCLSITLADCFISCWDEKYRSNVIRPETYINQYMDQNWVPLLQTPPFPEYTSGHSVVSAASALVLTRLFGEDFSYTDSTEIQFTLPPRNFTSFKEAAQEAAISRFYGGIHYMTSIRNGFQEGSEVAGFALNKLKTRKP